MPAGDKQHRTILQAIARRVMLEKGLLPDFSAQALAELAGIKQPVTDGQVRDQRSLLWASIDNEDSRDLDQLAVAEALPDGRVKVLVAVADVGGIVRKGSAIDEHARYNTTSVYTPAAIFPMLPEKLSTDLTSLNFQEVRPAVVVEMAIGADGSVQETEVYQALVRNQAKLAYNSVGAWLEGKGPTPEAVAAVDGLADNLRLQDRAAQNMKKHREVHGALSFETLETQPRFEGDEIRTLEVEKKNRARVIIEDFMIAANGVIAHFLSSNEIPALRRVVRRPNRWARIVEIAAEHGAELPAEPNSRALEEFLRKAGKADPLRFPDLSLAIIKLLGAGEYVADVPGNGPSPGHFGLAVRDYAHSTAPNRRYPDLVTQRLLKAALARQAAPYGLAELEALGKHCTAGEDAARKVERQVKKSAAAMLLASRLGEKFEALVTGAAPKGTWVRLLQPPIEGKLIRGFEGVDVGQRVRVQLIHTDVEQGFIDFQRVSG